MSRTTLGLVLGGALMLAVAGCAQQSVSETTHADVESLEAESSDVGSAVDQSPEGKPAVIVSRNPT